MQASCVLFLSHTSRALCMKQDAALNSLHTFKPNAFQTHLASAKHQVGICKTPNACGVLHHMRHAVQTALAGSAFDRDGTVHLDSFLFAVG